MAREMRHKEGGREGGEEGGRDEEMERGREREMKRGGGEGKER